mgnify:CR=1 FL=1
MDKKEIKIVQNVFWFVGVGLGLFTAKKIYDFGTLNYVRLIHPDVYKETLKEVLEHKD